MPISYKFYAFRQVVEVKGVYPDHLGKEQLDQGLHLLIRQMLKWKNSFYMVKLVITLKAPIKTAADDIHKYSFIVFQRK